MSSGSCSASMRARQTSPGRGAFCHIVQLVVVLHRMWRDEVDFRWSKAA